MALVRESCGSPREKRNSRRAPGYGGNASNSGIVSRRHKITVVAADQDYSITSEDDLVIAAPKSTGDATLTLPELSYMAVGQALTIKCTDPLGTNQVIVSRSGSDVIDDALTTKSLGQYQAITLVKAQDVSGTTKWVSISDV